MTNPPTQPGTQALDNRAEEQELNRLYDAIDTDPATRGTIDKMLADAEALPTSPPLPARSPYPSTPLTSMGIASIDIQSDRT